MARVLPKRMVRGEESERVGPGLVGTWEAYGWEWQDLIPVLKRVLAVNVENGL